MFLKKPTPAHMMLESPNVFFTI